MRTRRIRITLINGQKVYLEAIKLDYLNLCPYCDTSFSTENDSKRFCRDSHRVLYSQYGLAELTPSR